MKLTKYLFSLFSSTLFMFAVWLSILITIDPYSPQNDLLTTISFFASLFFWASGFLGFVIFYLKVNISFQTSHYELLKISVRQATLLSGMAVSMLALAHLSVLGPMEIILIIVIAFLFEMVFRSRILPNPNYNPNYKKNEAE